MRTLFGSLAIAGLLLGAGTASATTTLKFGSLGAPGSLSDKAINHFAELVSEKSNGEIEIQSFGSAQLGSDRDMLSKLKLGVLDFSLPSSIMSSEIDLFGMFEMPYLVRDREHMKRIEEEIVWPVLAPAAEERGYKILAVWENGFRNLTNSVRPIVKPEDLDGIKLRVPPGKWRLKMFEAYGANPSPMKFSELFVALQTGVMDGQENPLTYIDSSKFQEVQDYLSLSGHVYAPAYVTMGLNRYNQLPEETQKILTEAARETQAFVYETAATDDAALVKKLADEGMEVNEVDKDAFIAASGTIYEEFETEVPDAAPLVQKALELGQE
ncbi:TRAP transporter substrate-binding protein [Amorphus sp. 3PC139-8]|uniref:TRAP transporter substrate-binding protein n=1 Tax=Amorphus sp. 3PC139-8 TaxID=2735676 RepID=UPI00345D56B7